MSHPTKLVVLTGGPGAGKTAVLEYVRKVLCEHIVVFPEAAGILFGGGFWRLDSRSAKESAQRAIYHVQQEMQNLVINENRWSLGLCDRGTLDGLAYWPDGEKGFYESLGTDRQKEYDKYWAVIHLRSPNSDGGYNHQNPVRTESAEVAAMIDQKIYEVWKDHPQYHVIESQKDFSDKMHSAILCLKNYIPPCCGNGAKLGWK